MSNKKTSGITSFTLLGITFIMLKLSGIINWSWLWIVLLLWMWANSWLILLSNIIININTNLNKPNKSS